MTIRNLSPQQMFADLVANRTPELAFAGSSKSQFDSWQTKTLPTVLACLGDSPERVDLNPQLLAEWTHRGLRRQRWIIDVQQHMSATLLVNIPEDLKDGEARPALFCCHGHGPFGKEPIMGNDSSDALAANIAQHRSDYGETMAQLGFITYAIDFIGFGERNDTVKPNHHAAPGGRDWCNLYYLHATMLGMTSISINVTHGQAATDFAISLPQVDGERLGVMGLSGGGVMTLWMTLCDERFRAAEIMCYSDLWSAFGIRDNNYCGMQVAPGLFKYVDLPDVQGLIAPRPLLVDIGANDTCFRVDTAMACYRQVEKIYAAAGATDKLELDLHPGEHGWGGNLSEAFFRRHLEA